MKLIFLYNHPHPVHGAWAESVYAEFLQDRARFRIPGVSRIIKSLITLCKIPPDTDIILCESFSQLIAGSLWKSFHPEKKLACIVSDPKVYYLQQNSWPAKKCYTWMLRQCNLLLPTSPLMASLIPECTAIKKIVFPYVNLARYAPHHANLKTHAIIFTGRIGHEKGADRTIQAFQLLRQHVPDAQLFMVGFGDLQDALQQLEIPGITFTGWQEHPETFLEKSSIYLSLARIEPAGIAILEAMAAGLIPVVSEGVGNKYIVERISKELIVKNEAEAAAIITKLWQHPSQLQQYSKKARLIASQYGYEKSIQEFQAAMKVLGIQKFKKPSPQDANKYKPSLKPYSKRVAGGS